MTQTLTKYAGYHEAFQALESSAPKSTPPWLHELRRQAWSRFQQLGFPTARRGNEKWKYTNVAPIASAAFSHPAALPSGAQPTAGRVKQLGPSAPGWTNLVFVDGHYSPALSTQPGQAPGIVVDNLSKATVSSPQLVQPHLARQAGFEDDGFIALNTAFLQDGAFIHVADNRTAPAMINLLFVTTEGPTPKVTFPRVLVVAGKGSQVSLVETYVSPAKSRYFINTVTEIVVGDGANVEHCRLLLESPEAFHVGNTRVYQGQDSTFTSAGFFRGAALARNDFQVLLDGTGANCTVNGLYLTTDSQHVDHLIGIDHAKPHGTSRLLYKGILDGKSKAVFGGTVMVRKDAQKTDARQTDKNLLLSPDAEVDSKPSLLIFADDVKCAHGATAGHIDANTVFYMQSRGLDLATASRMLIHAFAREVIDTVQAEPLRDYLDGLFSQAMPASSLRFGGTP
ncbi:MAG: Fe-S cluster assembly protein SufD [Dehalococcoidia bacterium]|nr:Fe-S cluster assembly protein SufD [Dehalococcoidia bacterium]MSQ17253.1 Fe-S cluster assembly protein SufD [Dehalococcoidia bacterium]